MARVGYLVFSLVIFFSFAPVAKGYSLDTLGNGRLVITGSSSYRQRANHLWQRSPVAPVSAEKPVSWQGYTWLIGSSGDQTGVYRTSDGLQYEQVEGIPTEETATLRVVGDFLWLETSHEQQGELSYWDKDHFSLTSNNPTRPQEGVVWMDHISATTILLAPTQTQTVLYRLEGLDWLPETVLSGRAMAKMPSGGEYLWEDNSVWALGEDLAWRQLLPAGLRVSYSSQIIASQSSTNPKSLQILESGSITTIELPEAPEQIEAFANRILLRTGLIWQELLWNQPNPSLVQVTDQLSQAVSTGDGKYLGLAGENQAILPGNDPGSWSTFSTQGSWNHLERLQNSWLLWQTSIDKSSGGLTQLCQTTSNSCKKVNPWASITSPIQDIAGASPIFVLVNNSANHANLYSSMDGESWRKITLPETPTWPVDITTARSLPANTLVEIDGVGSVAPGAVGEGIFYLEDSGAGIQAYLSPSKGNIPNTFAHRLKITGEISSAQTKRVLLDSPLDLEVGDNQTPDRPAISIESVKDYLGRVVRLRSSATEISSTDLTLGSLKIHLPSANKLLRLGDQATVPALIDWNSGSSSIEGWAVDPPYDITPAPSVAQTEKPSLSAKTVSANATATKISSNATPVKAVPASVIRPSQPNAIALPLIGAIQSKPTDTPPADRSKPALTILGLLCGALISRGSRLTELLAVRP